MTRRRKAVNGMNRVAAGQVADRIHSAAIHLLRTLRRQDDKWGLSAPRLSALSVVVFAGPITLGELARLEQVRPPTMTRLVQALESARLVKRAPDSGDRRVTWIKATARGRQLLLKGRKERVKALTLALDTLTGAERDTLDAAAFLLERVAGEIPVRWQRAKIPVFSRHSAP
jgi:DNA-binding MarR family transcriptional regulator